MPSECPSTPGAVGNGRKVLTAWLVIVVLTASLSALTTRQALQRYREFRSGWSWDLAYYNQWYWSLLYGDRTITVRPISAYRTEGPQLWKTTHLAPVRLLLVPVYALVPGPETLLVVQNAVIWLVIPAAFTLVRAETRSTAIGLAGAGLVPFTPLLWPLVWNDFRELQLALPFVLWSVQGVRGRQVGLSALGIGGMLACRQEFAFIAMSLAVLPAREPEDIGRTYRWAHALIALGLAWILLAFFGFLRFTGTEGDVHRYVAQFLGPRATIGQALHTSTGFLVLGLGAWTLFSMASPRVAVLALPWLWSLAEGRWALHFLATWQWHHVRYAAPFVAMGLSAGLIGFGQVASWLSRRRRGRWWLAGVWLAAASSSCLALTDLERRMERQPPRIGPKEASAVWDWIGRVRPDEGVLAAYDVAAPLSSRRTLYSYILEINKPDGYPHLGPEFAWIFYRTADSQRDHGAFERQGFKIVHKGPYLTIFRWPSGGVAARTEEFPSFARTIGRVKLSIKTIRVGMAIPFPHEVSPGRVTRGGETRNREPFEDPNHSYPSDPRAARPLS